MDKLTLVDKIIGGGVLAGKKTYIASVLVIVAAVGAYLTGDIGLAELVTRIGEGGGLAFLRAGIAKGA